MTHTPEVDASSADGKTYIEQWYTEQSVEQQNWFDALDTETKITFTRHIEDNWKFLDSICALNGLTREAFAALPETTRMKLVCQRMTEVQQ